MKYIKLFENLFQDNLVGEIPHIIRNIPGVQDKPLLPIGTKVICIDDVGLINAEIELYGLYEIESSNKVIHAYKFKETKDYYYADRFVDELEYYANKYNL